MTDVIIAGIGQTPVGEHWELGIRNLATAAIRDALQNSGGLKPQALFVGNMLAPNLSRQAHLGALIAEYAGLTGIEAVTVEAAGASGGAALRQAYLAILSGFVEVALVVGVEKFTDTIGAEVDGMVASATDGDYEAEQGLTPTAQAALLMRRYQHEHQLPPDALEKFPLLAHANGAGNPHAMFRKAIKPEAYLKAEMISEPVNLLDVAPQADGAAALLLVRADRLPAGQKAVRIAASDLCIDTVALHDRHEVLHFQAVQNSVQRALAKAGQKLEDMDFFEYHDAYSIYAALSLEAAGFAGRGQGWRGCSLPCATLGGLKARGYPGGASGVYQAAEAALQLRGEAGACQVAGARLGMIQALGGPASTAVTHILEKVA